MDGNGITGLLSFHWSQLANPVPTRVISEISTRGQRTCAESGAESVPFDFSDAIRRLCADICLRCPTLGHVDVSRLLIGMTPSRTRSRYGLQARITPLRFEGGRLLRNRRGKLYGLQRYFVGDQEMLYHLTFCVPRFLNQEFHEKLITVFHELYHIDPTFNGDLRRHVGRCCLHSHSKREYDERMAVLVRHYLATRPDPQLHEPLRLTCRQLMARHGAIKGIAVARPKVIPISAP